MKKCSLSEDINQCQFFERKTKLCHNRNMCSYQEDENEGIINNHGYVRKERWYEKYYKK